MTTAAAPVNLTARGRGLIRLAAFASILVLGFSLLSAKAEGASVGGNLSKATKYQRITVAPGETLWQIALLVRSTTGFNGDLRDLVDEISSLNALSSPAISAGAHLMIPAPK